MFFKRESGDAGTLLLAVVVSLATFTIASKETQTKQLACLGAGTGC